jgi:hypothetical protein
MLLSSLRYVAALQSRAEVLFDFLRKYDDFVFYCGSIAEIFSLKDPGRESFLDLIP